MSKHCLFIEEISDSSLPALLLLFIDIFAHVIELLVLARFILFLDLKL